MYYNLKVNSEREMVNSIDSNKIVAALKGIYGEPEGSMDDIVVAFVRDPRRFKELCESLRLGRLEMLLYCVRIAPEAFNYHLLRFIKENYNFEFDSRTYL